MGMEKASQLVHAQNRSALARFSESPRFLRLQKAFEDDYLRGASTRLEIP